MAALRTFRIDPEEEARDVAACRRDLDRLWFRRLTVDVCRQVVVNEKWLARLRGETA